MLTVLLIGAGAFVLLAVLIAAAIFIRAAFWGEQDMAAEADAALTWRPSFLRGEALREWAATTAEQRAGRHLSGKRTGETATEIVNEIEEGAGHAMLPLARTAELERIVACPATGQGLVGVTAIEALAIATQIRKTHSRAEQKRIHDLAVENSRKIRSPSREINPPPVPCPLQGRDQVC